MFYCLEDQLCSKTIMVCQVVISQKRHVTKWDMLLLIQTEGRSGFYFPFRFAGGQLEYVTQAFGDSPKLSSSRLAYPWLIQLFRIYSLILGLVNTHANTKGFGLTSLFGVRSGFMPSQRKTNKNKVLPIISPSSS